MADMSPHLLKGNVFVWQQIILTRRRWKRDHSIGFFVWFKGKTWKNSYFM